MAKLTQATQPAGVLKPKRRVSGATRDGLWSLGLAAIFILTVLSLLESAGPFGIFWSDTLYVLFGRATWLFPIYMAWLALLKLRFMSMEWLDGRRYIVVTGLTLLLFILSAAIDLTVPLGTPHQGVIGGVGGGFVGLLLRYPLEALFGFVATAIILFIFGLAALIVTLNTSLSHLGSFLRRFIVTPLNAIRDFMMGLTSAGRSTVDDEDGSYSPSLFSRIRAPRMDKTHEETDTEDRDEEVENVLEATKAAKVASATVSRYKAVPIDLPLTLLEQGTEKPKSGDIKSVKLLIQKTFENFGIKVEMGEVSVGPTVTQYTLKPEDGVKLAAITALGNDLALALAAHPIRIEAPIPGKSLVGIEVPNKSIATVQLRDVFEDEVFQKRRSNLLSAFGKDVSGAAFAADLERMPHLLVAGATGSGKSVCLNAIILSLLYQNSPSDLRFILVDPKRVEFSVYQHMPHLLTPVITEVPATVNALKWLLKEMDRRFTVLSQSGDRNIQSYNKRHDEKLPFIILIIDELADLMVSAASEVEASIIRLAQMARAVGIHLVLATQRPSVDVITGLIKANVPTRVAFSVASAVDSRTILDSTGAEKLIGRGDMLYISAEVTKPKRVQGAFISDNEIRNVVSFLKDKAAPDYIVGVTEKQARNGGGSMVGEEDDDDLYGEAKMLVVEANKASASYLQRRLKVGYARAARLLDLLEANGVIGPGDGAKPREVLMSRHDRDILDGEAVDIDSEEALEYEEDEVAAPEMDEENRNQNPEEETEEQEETYA